MIDKKIYQSYIETIMRCSEKRGKREPFTVDNRLIPRNSINIIFNNGVNNDNV